MENDRHGLVIFDLDGTLFCADDATVPAVLQVFGQYGIQPPTEQQILDQIGPPEDELREWLRSFCPPDIAPSVVDGVFIRERELLLQTGRLYAGAQPAVASLRAMVGQMAMCTYASPGYAGDVLSGYGLASFFDVVRCRQSLVDDKRHMIRELLDWLPARPAVMIGDRAVDVEAAHANGLAAIGVLYGYGTAGELELAGADALATSAAQLPHLVHTLLTNGHAGK